MANKGESVVTSAVFETRLRYLESKLASLAVVMQPHIVNASTTNTIPNPADSPADADALRDDLVANAIPDTETLLNALGTKINLILTALENLGLVSKT